jgi:hypothetical protein
MQEHITEQELKERLAIIENMLVEGRRSTERWGWTFVLWGVAYYLAMAWSGWGHSAWAWPATMLIAVIITFVVASSKGGSHPETTLNRAIGSIWIAFGVSMFVLFPALAVSGRLTDEHLFVAVLSAMLGVANGASGLILRWKIQIACAIVWWAAAIASCFGSDARSATGFLIAIFLCQIAFGVYCVIEEAQGRKRRAPIHA